MVDDFAERIAAIAAQKQAEQDQAAKDAVNEHSDLRQAREQIALVVDQWNRFIVPTVNAKPPLLITRCNRSDCSLM